MKGQFPKGTGKLETQLACHLHPGAAANKTKMIHGDNPPYVCEPTPGGNCSLGRRGSCHQKPHLLFPAGSKQPSKCLLAE